MTAPPVLNIIPYHRGMSSNILQINSISYLMKCKQAKVWTVILIYYDGLTVAPVLIGMAIPGGARYWILYSNPSIPTIPIGIVWIVYLRGLHPRV